MEKQLADSKLKERNLMADISKLKQNKDKIFKDKRSLQEKYNAANKQLNDIRTIKEALLDEIKELKDKIKASNNELVLLQEKCLMSVPNVKQLQETRQTYIMQNLVLHEKMLASEQMMQAFQVNELAVSEELDSKKLMLTSAKRTNDGLVAKNITLKERLKSATRPWF